VKSNDPGDKLLSGTLIEDLVTSAFATGLLQLSEIAFDKSRRYAVLQFSFRCGGLCGHGGTLVFEKTNGRWQSKQTCSRWIA